MCTGSDAAAAPNNAMQSVGRLRRPPLIASVGQHSHEIAYLHVHRPDSRDFDKKALHG